MLLGGGGAVFPGRWSNQAVVSLDFKAVRQIPAALLSLVFPDDCRICGCPLQEFSRIPVCLACLRAPRPLVAEHFCTVCGTPFLDASPLDPAGRCGLCSRGITRFDAAFSYGEYEGPLRSLIHLLKYEGVRPLAKPLGRMLMRAVPRTQTFDLIVPMPLHWKRRWKRGFNQSDLLARHLSGMLHVPLCRAVKRVKATPSQAGLTLAERRDNLGGAFRCSHSELVAGKHVLLIDDVLTTGATMNACAAVLKRGGAARVSALTVARADRRRITMLGSPLSKVESGEFSE